MRQQIRIGAHEAVSLLQRDDVTVVIRVSPDNVQEQHRYTIVLNTPLIPKHMLTHGLQHEQEDVISLSQYSIHLHILKLQL